MEFDQRYCVIMKNYFYLIYKKYGITMPRGADWSFPQLPANLSWMMAVEVPRMLMELGEMTEDTRIPAMIQQCRDISENINESNYLSMYSTTVDTLLSNGLSVGKLIVFCAFSAGYCIYLCKCNISDHCVKEIYKAAQEILQIHFKPWIESHHGWVSSMIAIATIFCFIILQCGFVGNVPD